MTARSASSAPTFVLTLLCPDRPGLVHAVTGLLVEQHANILESQQFDDLAEDRFFMRVKFAVDSASPVPELLETLRSAFAGVAERFSMTWELWDATAPYRTLILVSKFSHCLNDLLFRWSRDALQIDVAGVVSNHLDCEAMVKSYGVPYHHIPVTPETKADAERQMLGLVDSLDVHLVVLARYMQVISDDTCRALEGRAINIHHSFLPSFKGARPYHQAFDRGVKLVGATAHYVTADLDEGPIIEQDVMRVDHRYGPTELAAAGRDVESQVLSRAVRWHAESRVLLNGHKTVVFR
ncbi:MAG TPA: formyltetrahydrofolate deformylase [Nocardioidaceae bacterium]|nr:formyltetrahydrofolate deformylase [Nocardioidaceae bacterium]